VTVKGNEELRDAMFLHRHPGWDWQGLQDTPAQVVEYVRMIDRELAGRAEALRRRAEARR